MENKKHKRGDVREDGMVFWQHDKRCPNSEYWVTRENFTKRKAKAKEYAKKVEADRTAKFESMARTQKRGDVRDDGMIFWGYSKLAKGGQSWCTPERFEEKRKSLADYKRKYRRANKDAIADKDRERQQKNKESLKEYNKKYREANKEKFAAQAKDYYQANRDKILDKVKEHYQNNKEAINTHKGERYNNDPLYKLAVLSRCRIFIAFKKQGYTKKSKTQKMLGCSFNELVKHVEVQFVDGMTWGNQGEWHLDHRLPLSAATNENELIKLNHYSNLQPLWAEDNLRKCAAHDPEELKAYLAA